LSPIRVVGSVFSLLTGLLGALVLPLGLARAGGAGVTRLGGLLFLVGAVLVLVSIISFVVPKYTFVISAILSVVVLGVVAARFDRFNQGVALVTVVLATVAVVVDALAARPAKELAEKDSPLNLPVFG